MKTLSYIIFLFIFFSTNSFTQEIKQVKGAKGSGIIVGRISEKEAREEALNAAKVEALRMAGVVENLSSYELLFRSELDFDYSEFFSSDVHSDLQGAVKNYTIVKQDRMLDPHTQLFQIEISIDADVILYSVKPDPEFLVKISGIKNIYEEGEKLKFNVNATKDCYLHIFSLSENETCMMYPNNWETHKLIPGMSDISFPFGHVDYYLEKTEKSPEVNRILFVFTKTPIKFINYQGEYQITSPEKIFSWVYSITPDIRRLEYKTFTIR